MCDVCRAIRQCTRKFFHGILADIHLLFLDNAISALDAFYAFSVHMAYFPVVDGVAIPVDMPFACLCLYNSYLHNTTWFDPCQSGMAGDDPAVTGYALREPRFCHAHSTLIGQLLAGLSLVLGPFGLLSVLPYVSTTSP